MNATSPRDTEVLGLLRSKYESEGYTFIQFPGREFLPTAFGSYTPDAIALKGNEKIAIEIRQSDRKADAEGLTDITKRFYETPDWKLVVFYSGSSDQRDLRATTATVAKIRQELSRAEELADHGEYSAAFVIAWAALEAIARARDADQTSKILSARSVVESLERNGYIGPTVGGALRRFIILRNAVIHGDYTKAPDKKQVGNLIRHVRTLVDEWQEQ